MEWLIYLAFTVIGLVFGVSLMGFAAAATEPRSASSPKCSHGYRLHLVPGDEFTRTPLGAQYNGGKVVEGFYFDGRFFLVTREH